MSCLLLTSERANVDFVAALNVDKIDLKSAGLPFSSLEGVYVTYGHGVE